MILRHVDATEVWCDVQPSQGVGRGHGGCTCGAHAQHLRDTRVPGALLPAQQPIKTCRKLPNNPIAAIKSAYDHAAFITVKLSHQPNRVKLAGDFAIDCCGNDQCANCKAYGVFYLERGMNNIQFFRGGLGRHGWDVLLIHEALATPRRQMSSEDHSDELLPPARAWNELLCLLVGTMRGCCKHNG